MFMLPFSFRTEKGRDLEIMLGQIYLARNPENCHRLESLNNCSSSVIAGIPKQGQRSISYVSKVTKSTG